MRSLIDSKGVSSVVGVMLMLGIVVLLVAVTGTYAMITADDSLNTTGEERDGLFDQLNEKSGTTDSSGDEFVGSEPHMEAPDCSEVEYNLNSDGKYEISNDYQLQCIPYNSRELDYVLTQNIDASGTEEWNDGKGFDPIGINHRTLRYTGTFDGQGYRIDGLYIDRPDSEWGVGLFGGTYKWTTIKNVGVTNVDITGNEGVGGLIGVNDASIGTYADMRKTYTTGEVSGSKNVGGLIGSVSSGHNVDDSYSDSVVNGDENVGGFIGSATGYGSTTSSYATGDVSGSDNVGGLVGYMDSSGRTDFYDSYWDTESEILEDGTDVSDEETNGGDGGLTTDEMQGDSAKDNMSFDFEDTWTVEEGEYPKLQRFE